MHTLRIHYAYIMHTLCIHYINNFFPQSRLFLRCCHAQKTKFEKMAGKEEQCCSSCFNNTKYTCLRCQEYFCIPCSVFENDETVKGWKAGTSVAYCEPCFREVLKLFMKKANGQKKKKPGRKAKWCPQARDDLIDIIVSNSSYKKKLIFTNTKNQRNGELYGEILKEGKARASARGEHFDFSVNQLRSKFKKCVSLCKQAALTQKSATGIKRFQEDQGLGKWFTTLFEVVKARESCQPGLALEPSASS